MRVLIFTTLYPNELQPQHGIFVETRLRKLVETGMVEARVLAPCPWFPFSSNWFGRYGEIGRIPRQEERAGLFVEHPRFPVLPKIGMSLAPLTLFSALLPLLRRQIRDGQDFDLIDAHYFYPDGVAAVMLGKALDRPVVVTARGSDLNILPDHTVPRKAIQWAAARANGLVTVSNGLKQRLLNLGIAAEHVKVLRNGVDLALFRPQERASARNALGFTRRTLLSVGNLVPLKRHRLMVETLALLQNVDLVIVGAGPERAAIESLAQSLGVADRVRLLGRVPQRELPLIYSAADLFLLFSSHEGWPNVLLESMACGTSVIVSNMNGIDEIVGAPEAGHIALETTPLALAAVIRRLLDNPPDREATRRYAAQFDWQSTTDGQLELFNLICNRYPTRAVSAT